MLKAIISFVMLFALACSGNFPEPRAPARIPAAPLASKSFAELAAEREKGNGVIQTSNWRMLLKEPQIRTISEAEKKSIGFVPEFKASVSLKNSQALIYISAISNRFDNKFEFIQAIVDVFNETDPVLIGIEPTKVSGDDAVLLIVQSRSSSGLNIVLDLLSFQEGKGYSIKCGGPFENNEEIISFCLDRLSTFEWKNPQQTGSFSVSSSTTQETIQTNPNLDNTW